MRISKRILLTAFVLLVVMTSLVTSGCSQDAKEDELLKDAVDIVGVFGLKVQGRDYIISMLETKDEEASVIDHFLQIEGDNIIVSFYSSTTPFVPVINGDTINYGGHTYTITQVPNVYIVNNQRHQLAPQNLYVFNDGNYEGPFAPYK